MSDARVAVVGAGRWGKNLVRVFHELGGLGAICDSSDLLEQHYREKYPDVPFVSDFEEVLSDSSLNAVIIATPAKTHFALAMQALEAGKHVFVEKPLALSIKEGEQLIAAAASEALTLMVGHILHYHPAVVRLKELIAAGELGKLQYVYSHRLNIGMVRHEENALWSFAPHDISAILMLLGEEPAQIAATGGSYLQNCIADVTMTQLDFRSGVKAHIFVSWLHPFKEQKLVVVGDRKMAVFDDVSETKLMLYPHEIKWLNRMPVATRAECERIELGSGEPLKAECEHFLDCVISGLTPRTDGQEGLRVLRVLQACQDSMDCKL